MSPAEYILDPRFEAICLGVANLTDDPFMIDGPDIPHFIQRLEQHRTTTGQPICMVSHNAQFDMAIMAWRYDFHPDLIIDTIAMSPHRARAHARPVTRSTASPATSTCRPRAR